MLRKNFQTEINVDFIDVETNHIFAKSKIPIKQLPKSFDKPTNLNFGNEDWQVISAKPNSVEEIKKTKRLQLIVRKIFQVDPNNILYSIPSLSNDSIDYIGIDYIYSTLISDNQTATIHSDDWRQIEFVSKAQETILNNNIKNISTVYQNQINVKNLNGFSTLYVRTLSSPLDDIHLTLNTINASFKIKNQKYLSFPDIHNITKIVKNGFYYELFDHSVL